MTPWTRLNDRVKYRDTFDGVQLRMPAPRHWWPLVFLPFWWTLWTAGGFATIYAFISGGGNVFLAVWLCGWLAGWVGAAFVWLWIAFGVELVTVGQGLLALRYDILGRGYTRRSYTDEVRGLRAAGVFGGKQSLSDAFASIGLGGGVIAYEASGKTYRFGGLLEEGQAREVVEVLARHLPEDALAQRI